MSRIFRTKELAWFFDGRVEVVLEFGFGEGFMVGPDEVGRELGELLARAASVELVGRKDAIDLDWFVHCFSLVIIGPLRTELLTTLPGL